MKDTKAKIDKCEQILANLCLTEVEVLWNRVAILREGSSFGELALIDRKGLRAARIVCTKKCAMGIITRGDYDKCIAKIEKKLRDTKIAFLYTMP
jgi:hypothetical protein